MSSRTPVARSRRQRRMITFLWTAVLSIVIIALIYWEKTAILYILATLSVTALLVVVALADLRGSAKSSAGSTPDSTAI